MSETDVADIRPLDGDDGTSGYEVATRRSTGWLARAQPPLRARGVVVAGGALGTNRLPARCRLAGGLPTLSPRLGEKVRTNSEPILTVTLPDDRLQPSRDVAIISANVHLSQDTHIEIVSYGERGSVVKLFFTLLTGEGTRLTRPLKLFGQVLQHPLRFMRSLSPRHCGRLTVILLVMQSLDNAIASRRGPLGGVHLATRQDAEQPNPTFIQQGYAAAQWLAQQTGAWRRAC